MKKPKLFIFASGTADGGGSGFENLCHAAQHGPLYADIVGVASNHMSGGVRKKAAMCRIPFFHFQPPWSASAYQRIADNLGADFFALSGWTKLICGLDPGTSFNSRTVFNIHPGPLPDFGGKGMYGHRVHQAVMAAYKQGTISHTCACMHFVTEEYDQGPQFFRGNLEIIPTDTPESIQQSIQQDVEHAHQARITNMVINGMIRWDGIDPDSLEVPRGYNIERMIERTERKADQ